MTAIGGSAAFAPMHLPREAAQRSASPAAECAANPFADAVRGQPGSTTGGQGKTAADPAQELDAAQLAMIPERFWPYEIWLRERGWTDEGGEGSATETSLAATGLRAYRETAQRTAQVARPADEAGVAADESDEDKREADETTADGVTPGGVQRLPDDPERAGTAKPAQDGGAHDDDRPQAMAVAHPIGSTPAIPWPPKAQAAA